MIFFRKKKCSAISSHAPSLATPRDYLIYMENFVQNDSIVDGVKEKRFGMGLQD